MTAGQTYLQLQQEGWSLEQIASRFRIRQDSVRRHIDMAKNGLEGRYFDSAAISLPESSKRSNSYAQVPEDIEILHPAQIAITPAAENVEPPLQVPTDNALVFGDTHFPLHNVVMLQRALWVKQKFFSHIRTLVHGGDAFNFDRFSQHPKNAPMMGAEDQLQIAAQCWRSIATRQWFDDVYVIPGNHDEWLAKAINDDIRVSRLYGMIFDGKNQWPEAEFHFTNLDYLYLGDQWVVGHPASYSGQGGKMPATLGNFYDGRNAISFHNHIVGQSQNQEGTLIGIDAGHMTDPDKHFYSARRFSKFARWNAGFVIISNGYHYHYTERWTDWQSLGC